MYGFISVGMFDGGDSLDEKRKRVVNASGSQI